MTVLFEMQYSTVTQANCLRDQRGHLVDIVTKIRLVITVKGG